jgi:adenylosuccinate lyase
VQSVLLNILSPKVEEYVCKNGTSTCSCFYTGYSARQTCRIFSTLALIGSTLEKIAVEIRHLQRTEVLEAEEYFSKGQKGSSAMPHKRNPIVSERITGLARVLRAMLLRQLKIMLSGMKGIFLIHLLKELLYLTAV